MKTTFGIWLSALGVLAMALPVHANDGVVRKSEKPAVTDVILTTGGKLAGLIVKPDGTPSANTPVQVIHRQNVVATVRTDKNGRYAIQGIRSGLHKVRTPHGEKVCRCWYSKSAPPTAKKQLLLTADPTIVRGNSPLGLSTGQILGAGTFALTTTALWASVGQDNPVQKGAPEMPPASP